jgi:hypothetical protein
MQATTPAEFAAMRLLPAIATALLAAISTTACGTGGTGRTSQPATPAPADTTPAKAPPTAATILAAITRAGLITGGQVQTVDTDPNQLLGRPGGYVSRASFDLPGGDPDGEPGTIERGGVIEVFTDAAGAKRRADYIADFTTGTPALNGEYDTLHGAVLLRIDHPVAPDVAGRVDAAVAAAL